MYTLKKNPIIGLGLSHIHNITRRRKVIYNKNSKFLKKKFPKKNHLKIAVTLQPMGLRQSLTYHRIAHTGRFSKLKTVCRYESWFARKLKLKISKSLGIYKHILSYSLKIKINFKQLTGTEGTITQNHFNFRPAKIHKVVF
jgi:hypothetical protein